MSFTVNLRADGLAVVISWQTSSEGDTAGFYLYRRVETSRVRDAAQENGDFVPITPLIPSKGAQGGAYEFVDSDVQDGVEYSYLLVEKKNDGSLFDYDERIEPIVIGGEQPVYNLWLPMVAK